MLTGEAYMEHQNHVAGIINRNMCAEYGLKVPGSRWETTPKVIGNKWVRSCGTSRSKLVMAYQPDTVLADKHQRAAVVKKEEIFPRSECLLYMQMG